jgi:hypothetical protein
MKIGKIRIPLRLIITTVVLFILGFAAQPLIEALATEEQLTRNVILNAIPFVLIFVAILMIYIMIIVAIGSWLNDKVPLDTYNRIERVFMAGIVLGVLGMFQPWLFILYRVGFMVLLISTLGFILWTHIRPARKKVAAKR